MDLAERLPAGLQAPFRQFSTLVSTSVWVFPTIAGVLGLPAALIALRLPADLLPFELPFGDPEDSRAALTTVLSATVAAMSLVFTGTVVAIQLATGQYSPRLLRNVLLDPRIRTALGVFVGTVVYTLTIIPQISSDDDPQIAISVGLLLGLGVVASLVAFLDGIVSRLRLETIVGDVRDQALAAIDIAHPPDDRHDDVDLDENAVAVASLRSGYVQSVSLDALTKAIEQHDCSIAIRPRIGDFLVTGTDAASVWRSDGRRIDDDELDRIGSSVDRALALGVDRTPAADPAYALRHLVDIGLRGVSPGINDPTTTTQTIHFATDVLVRLARRVCSDDVARSGDRVALVRRPDYEAYLELAQSQLLQYGGHDPRVVEALAHQLRDIVTGGTCDDRIGPVRRRLRLLHEDADRREHGEAGTRIITEACDTVEDLLDGADATDEDQAAG